MAKKLTSICVVLSMLMALSLTGMAYTLPADANAVTVSQANGVYTVTVSNPVYANAEVTVTAVANGEAIPESMTDSTVAYFSGKEADANGEATFTFEPKEGFNNENGLYVAVATERGVDTVIAKAEYSVASIISAHGQVSADREVIKEGDTVSFYIDADFGYVATDVSVTGGVLTESNEGGFVVAKVKDNLAITVLYEVAAAEIGAPGVFNSVIKPSEFAEKYGENFSGDALTAKYAAVIFSKVSADLYECGIVYSKENNNPTVGGENCIVRPAANIGAKGAFGIYLYSDEANDATYYVKSYVKSGDSYIYGNATTFSLSEVDTTVE